ncbi:XRE family transcriptional regulator [Haloechinothrix sp. YIM 98757]|uniref:XRE family transcriptional regulator n=1 Tax=Haloechinothrix aidingensis TaxID=2752311 RepID=A0A838A658_9PSEU|nr:XRE family transcriptional regulator [Haloechinothrix aidingensis]MBA0124295.1 XRE family transcriptional regulator [Haloechinothrix aidingensis]
MGRAELAEAVNRYIWQTTGKRHQLDAHTIARYERGAVRWPSAAYRWGLRAVLDADSDADLGFYPTRRGNSQSPTRSDAAAGKAFDVRARVGFDGSPAEFLANTTVESPVPTRLGWTEVEHVRATTRAVAMSENLFGGGLSCEAATAQLRWAGQLLDVSAAREVHRAIAEAVGNLAGVVAYSAFDIANYAAADRCFAFALWCADASGSWSLRANTLADMARKAVYLGDLDYALELIEFAEVRSDRLTATARAMLATIRARLLALTGRHAEARADIDRADGHFADHDPAVDPPWLCYYDAAEHHGSTGKALIPIAQMREIPELATSRLDEAIRRQGTEYPRSRTFSRIRLATLLMNTGYPQEALPIGRQAVVDSGSLRSKRLLTELQGLAGAAEAYSHLGDVAELRHNITSMSHPAT